MNKEVYEWSYDGACAPGNSYASHITFSVGIFQWIPKKKTGLKRSKVICRIKGYTSKPEEVYEKANRLIELLNRDYKFELTQSEFVELQKMIKIWAKK